MEENILLKGSNLDDPMTDVTCDFFTTQHVKFDMQLHYLLINNNGGGEIGQDGIGH